MKRKFYSVAELAAALHVTPQRVRQLCAKGQVVGAKKAFPGGPWLIPKNPKVVYRKRGRPRKR